MNEYILGKQKLKGKKVPRAARCLRFEIFKKRFLSLHLDPLSHFIYMQVHDAFRNYLARMRAFDGRRSLLTVENRSSSLSIKVTKILVPSLTKNGVRRTIYC